MTATPLSEGPPNVSPPGAPLPGVPPRVPPPGVPKKIGRLFLFLMVLFELGACSSCTLLGGSLAAQEAGCPSALSAEEVGIYRYAYQPATGESLVIYAAFDPEGRAVPVKIVWQKSGRPQESLSQRGEAYFFWSRMTGKCFPLARLEAERWTARALDRFQAAELVRPLDRLPVPR